jgi:hypothetical protein
LNIVTQHLLKNVKDPELIAFVEAWDRLELMVIDIYKRGRAEAEEVQAHDELRRTLGRSYGQWKPRLDAHWAGLEAGGQPVEEDPFRAVLGRRRAQAFVDDWKAMTTLPVARQALNEFLIELGPQPPGDSARAVQYES